MSYLPLIFGLAIGLPALVFLIRSDNDTLQERMFFSGYWNGVKTTFPMSMLGVAILIGSQSFESAANSTWPIHGLMMVLFFPTALLYFKILGWLSIKVWKGMPIVIHFGIPAALLYFFAEQGKERESALEFILFMATAVCILWIAAFLFAKIKSSFS